MSYLHVVGTDGVLLTKGALAFFAYLVGVLEHLSNIIEFAFSLHLVEHIVVINFGHHSITNSLSKYLIPLFGLLQHLHIFFLSNPFPLSLIRSQDLHLAEIILLFLI